MIDAHCHFITASLLDAVSFGALCTEASTHGVSYLDYPAALAIRRWCPPVLDLPAFASFDDYLARRAELGPDEVNRRLLRAAGVEALFVDTGLRPSSGRWLDLDGLAAASGAVVREVVRLETVAEDVAAAGASAAGFAAAFTSALAEATRDAVAVKSVLAYRHGLDIDPARPTPYAVTAAADGWLRAGGGRLTDPTLLRFLLWSALDLGLPIQLHTGFGDRDLRLHRSDPSLLQEWYAAAEPSGVPIVLLHCYPYHRQAGWLAHVYPNVYVDVGLTVTHASPALGEFFELAPFTKLLYSSDAYGLAELFLVGAAQFRAALSDWLTIDADRITAAVTTENARRVYGHA